MGSGKWEKQKIGRELGSWLPATVIPIHVVLSRYPFGGVFILASWLYLGSDLAGGGVERRSGLNESLAG